MGESELLSEGGQSFEGPNPGGSGQHLLANRLWPFLDCELSLVLFWLGGGGDGLKLSAQGNMLHFPGNIVKFPVGASRRETLARNISCSHRQKWSNVQESLH